MIRHLILTIAILIVGHISCGLNFDSVQTFKKDWAGFNSSSNWTIYFLDDSSGYAYKPSHGQLVFRNIVDTTLVITYYVYLKSEMDSAFNIKISLLRMVETCVTIDFLSFQFKQYYYLVKPCHACNLLINKDCELLAKQLQNFVKKE